MASLNRVLLMGNLTRDIELKHIASNQAVAEIGLAVNRRYRTKDNEEREEVTFVDCEAWGRTAEVMKQYLSKGKPVFIEGRLKLDQWTDKDGQKRSKLRVVVENFQFLPAGGQSRGGEGRTDSTDYSRSTGGSSSGEPAPMSPTHEPAAGDDIPF